MSPARRTLVSPLGSAVDLPHLSPAEAYVVADILERICQAIWDAYGDDMLDVVVDCAPPVEPPPQDDDLDIPF